MDPDLDSVDDTLGNNPDIESVDEESIAKIHLAKDELAVGTVFPNYAESCRSIQEYFDNNFESLVIRPTDDGTVKEGSIGYSEWEWESGESGNQRKWERESGISVEMWRCGIGKVALMWKCGDGKGSVV